MASVYLSHGEPDDMQMQSAQHPAGHPQSTGIPARDLRWSCAQSRQAADMCRKMRRASAGSGTFRRLKRLGVLGSRCPTAKKDPVHVRNRIIVVLPNAKPQGDTEVYAKFMIEQ